MECGCFSIAKVGSYAIAFEGGPVMTVPWSLSSRVLRSDAQVSTARVRGVKKRQLKVKPNFQRMPDFRWKLATSNAFPNHVAKVLNVSRTGAVMTPCRVSLSKSAKLSLKVVRVSGSTVEFTILSFSVVIMFRASWFAPAMAALRCKSLRLPQPRSARRS